MNNFIGELQNNATIIAELDCLLGFAKIAKQYNYSKPELNDSLVIDIKEGRHPVIERNLPLGEEYVSNDLYLDNSTQQIIMVTGPNMSGKSALLRQTALITLMAQMGSFVPAKKAKIERKAIVVTSARDSTTRCRARVKGRPSSRWS